MLYRLKINFFYNQHEFLKDDVVDSDIFKFEYHFINNNPDIFEKVDEVEKEQEIEEVEVMQLDDSWKFKMNEVVRKVNSMQKVIHRLNERSSPFKDDN